MMLIFYIKITAQAYLIFFFSLCSSSTSLRTISTSRFLWITLGLWKVQSSTTRIPKVMLISCYTTSFKAACLTAGLLAQFCPLRKTKHCSVTSNVHFVTLKSRPFFGNEQWSKVSETRCIFKLGFFRYTCNFVCKLLNSFQKRALRY